MKKFLIILASVSLLIYNSACPAAQIVAKASTTNTVTDTDTVSETQTSFSQSASDIGELQREPDTSPWPKDAPKIASKAGIVMEASTGAILYSKNIHQTFYPASITKILTALIAIENSSLGETVEFSKNSVYDVELDSSRLWIDVGEKLTMEQCLYGMMLESANDVAYAIAEHVAGNIKSFAQLMNEKAKELGCVDSNFVNPHGLPDPDHYTSAYDMALISKAAINNKTFREIAGTRTYIIPPTNKQTETRYLTNHHKFVNNAKTFDGCIGGKTGYTTKAKYTLVTFAERNGVTLISVILNCDSITDEYDDTSKILNYAFNNYTSYNISKMEEPSAIDSSALFAKYSSLFNETNSCLQISPNGNIMLPNNVDFSKAKKHIFLSPVSKIVEGTNIIGSIAYTYKGLYVGSADIIFNNVKDSSLLEGSYAPTSPPSKSGISDNSNDQTSNLRMLIIGIIAIILFLAILLYILLVEIPFRRRRNAYHQRKKHKHPSDKNFF
jgi:D-alanyl-D-alanine carboxypeptidase